MATKSANKAKSENVLRMEFVTIFGVVVVQVLHTRAHRLACVHCSTAVPTTRTIKRILNYVLFRMCPARNCRNCMEKHEHSNCNRQILTSFNLYCRHFISGRCGTHWTLNPEYNFKYTIHKYWINIIWPLSKIASLNDNKYALFCHSARDIPACRAQPPLRHSHTHTHTSVR